MRLFRVLRSAFRCAAVPLPFRFNQQFLKINYRNYHTTLCNKHSQNCRNGIVLQKRSSPNREMGVLSPLDPSSYSRPEIIILNHASLKLKVKFEDKVLSGSALLSFDVLKEVNELLLDVGNQSIESVELEDGSPLKYEVTDFLENFGSKLTIQLPTPSTAGSNHIQTNTDHCISLQLKLHEYKVIIPKRPPTCCPCIYCTKNNGLANAPGNDVPRHRLNISIHYTTAPSASALQWLDPPQTSGKKHPYMFSQCQPIHARSILPCQDTPYVKFTYDAEIEAPEEFTVLMSALRLDGVERTAGGTKTKFNQPIPIPAYLLAIAVGVLESRRLGPRSIVWSEKAEIERSLWEFAETEKYLTAAESLCGRYEWSQYDLLVLPPSFPYGGMENPCLTFVTPTLLAGDRSQADVIVHEIMHSWTGNLVTNRNFEHFWLNEGFTVFLERKVAASLIADPEEAKRSRDFQSLLGLQQLKETVYEELGENNPLTALVVDLKGVHPDDAFSSIPYEKGSLFLRVLEDVVGGPAVFDDFLRSYLTEFKNKSLDTDQFKSYLLNYFKDNKDIQNLDWNAWLFTSGMPPTIPDYDTTMSKACSELATTVAKENADKLSYDDINAFTPHQIIHFLQELIDREPLSLDKVKALGDVYKLNESKNTEIVYRWLRIRIKSKDDSVLNEAFTFVNSQGRMKYVRPIYRDLYAWEDVRASAIENFLKNEPYMMHVSAYTLRKDLHI